MIRKNKLKLSPVEQRNLENDFKDKIEQRIKRRNPKASRDYEPSGDFEDVNFQPQYKRSN